MGLFLNKKRKIIGELLQDQDITIVDIGARDLGVHFFQGTTKFVHFVGVECELEEAKRLNSLPNSNGYRSFYFSDKGISLEGEVATLWITPNAGSSSMKKPSLSYASKYNRPGAYTESQKQTIRTQNIENLLKGSQGKKGGLVFKLDIEGSELDVLRGLQASASRLLLLKTEVSFQRIRLDQAMPSEMLIIMVKLGFDLVEIQSIDDLRYSGDSHTFPNKNSTLSNFPIYSKGDIGTAEFIFLRRLETVPPALCKVFAAICIEIEQFDKAANVLEKLPDREWRNQLFKTSKACYRNRLFRLVLRDAYTALTALYLKR